MRRTHPITAMLGAAGLAAALLAGACMTSPREGQVLAERTSTFSFEGYDNSPYEQVQLHCLDEFGQWQVIATAMASGTPTQDNDGLDWYRFRATGVTIPDPCWIGPTMAEAVLNEARSTARLMAVTTQAQQLVFFEDATADECWGDNHYVGLDIIANCAAQTDDGYVHVYDYLHR